MASAKMVRVWRKAVSHLKTLWNTAINEEDWPYVNQATCLVADLDDIEKEPTIYNFLTHEVYENDTWIHREIDLRWKLLVHLTPEQRESVPPANHSMNGGIYHERTTI